MPCRPVNCQIQAPSASAAVSLRQAQSLHCPPRISQPQPCVSFPPATAYLHKAHENRSPPPDPAPAEPSAPEQCRLLHPWPRPPTTQTHSFSSRRILSRNQFPPVYPSQRNSTSQSRAHRISEDFQCAFPDSQSPSSEHPDFPRLTPLLPHRHCISAPGSLPPAPPRPAQAPPYGT